MWPFPHSQKKILVVNFKPSKLQMRKEISIMNIVVQELCPNYDFF